MSLYRSQKYDNLRAMKIGHNAKLFDDFNLVLSGILKVDFQTFKKLHEIHRELIARKSFSHRLFVFAPSKGPGRAKERFVGQRDGKRARGADPPAACEGAARDHACLPTTIAPNPQRSQSPPGSARNEQQPLTGGP